MGQVYDKLLSPSTHSIRVKTGETKYAGTDANIGIRLHHEDGEISPLFNLDAALRDDFEKGRIDEFKIGQKGMSPAGVAKIEVMLDSGGLASTWHCHYIQVIDLRVKRSFLFPVDRWISGGRSVIFQQYDAILPQFDAHTDQRVAELEERRREYEYIQKDPGQAVQVKYVPDMEQFADDYTGSLVQEFVSSFGAGILRTLFSSSSTSTLKRYERIHTLFSSLGTPKSVKYWREDSWFGATRVAGCNPDIIKLCTEIPDNFGVTADMVAPFLEGMTLSDAMAAKKIYLTDLKTLESVVNINNKAKLCCPLGLFYMTKDARMMPIAIQLEQEKGDNNPVFLPNDDAYLWMMVKMWYGMADSQYHEGLSHLGNTHFVAGSFNVCMKRILSPSHPVYRLLAPHFHYLMAINDTIPRALMNKNGVFGSFFTAGVAGMMKLAIIDNFRLDFDMHLPNSLKARGVWATRIFQIIRALSVEEVDDTEAMPFYPYRDDALLSWNALHKYVKNTVAIYYEDNTMLLEDHEIQQWAKELVTPIQDGGVGIKGMPGNGKFETIDDLVDTLTCLIYQCSVKHAAVNFSQYDEYAFPPNRPAHLSGEPPRNKNALTEKHIIAALPQANQTFNSFFKTLSLRATQPLGHFDHTFLHDPRALKVAQELRADLVKASQTIQERNKSRQYIYDLCDPVYIPNSISI